MDIEQKKWALKGAVLGFLSVVLGAMGAHWFQSKLTVLQLGSLNTALYFLFFHALLFLLFSIKYIEQYNKALWFIFIGISLFSGSIVLFSFMHAFSVSLIPFSHFITPIGGFVLIAGWGMMVYKSVMDKKGIK